MARPIKGRGQAASDQAWSLTRPNQHLKTCSTYNENKFGKAIQPLKRVPFYQRF